MSSHFTPLTVSPRPGDPPTDDTAVGQRRSATGSPEPPIAANIGRHVIIERVGRGGAGFVYRAYDPRLQREVALKRLRPGAMGQQSRLRFEQEARSMAALSHPNVVAVYDVEFVDANEIALVMEFVDGPTLRAWLRQAERPWNETLVPFIEAGRGLAAAHRAGLLHRDFKPANVLIAAERAKVTDFGIAKRSVSGGRIDSSCGDDVELDEGTEDVDLTEEGVVVGTPRYMAPEQHTGTAQLTPAVDQFAFCVSLWEALTKKRAYKRTSLRRQKAKGPPEWPSACGPRWLGDALARGMHPDPSERWPSMDVLIAQLSRAPNRLRNRIVRGTAMAGLVGIAAGTAYAAGSDVRTPCQAVEAELSKTWNEDVRARTSLSMASVDVVYAEPVSRRIVARLDAYAEAWSTQRRVACEAAVRGDYSANLRDRRASCLDRGRVSLDAVVGVLSTADVDILRRADTLVAELPPLARCSDLAALQSGDELPTGVDEEAVVAAQTTLEQARVQRLAGHFEDAERLLASVEAKIASVGYLPIHGAYQYERGELLAERGQLDLAERAHREALQAAVATRNKDLTATSTAELIRVAAKRGRYAEVAALRPVAESAADEKLEWRVLSALGLALSYDGNFEEGEALLRRAAALLSEQDRNDERLAQVRASLGNMLLGRGRFADAEAEYQAAIDSFTATLGADHPKVAITRGNRARALNSAGRLDEALVEARKSDEARRRSFGATHLRYGTGKISLADVLTDARKFTEAEATASEAVRIIQESSGRIGAHSADAVNALGRIQLASGNPSKAETTFREARAIRTKLHQTEKHPAIGGLELNIAVSLSQQGRYAEAEERYNAALEIYLDSYGTSHPSVSLVHINLAILHLDTKRYAEALTESEKGLAITRALNQPTSAASLAARSTRASALAELGQLAEAETEVRDLVRVEEEKNAADSPQLALRRVELARVLLRAGRGAEARKVAEDAWNVARKDGLSPSEQAGMLLVLAQSISASDDSPEAASAARHFAEQAIQLYVQGGPGTAKAVQDAREWLRTIPTD